MIENYKGKIELKAGRYAYVQTEQYKKKAQKYIADIHDRWSPPANFFHLKRKGGHVAAINKHQESVFFAKMDLSNFFGHITKSKIINSLTKIRFDYDDAREIAVESTVYCKNAQYFHLPYGFVQSPLLASLVLAKSNLYRQIKLAKKSGVNVSVYVDDIILSSNDQVLLNNEYQLLMNAAVKSNFPVNFDKSHDARDRLVAFNIDMKSGKLRVTENRQDLFEQNILLAENENVQRGIINYVGSVNCNQAKALEKLASSPLANISC